MEKKMKKNSRCIETFEEDTQTYFHYFDLFYRVVDIWNDWQVCSTK